MLRECGLLGLILTAILTLLSGGCPRGESATPPPEAQRPVIRSQADLEAERHARVAAGEIVVNDAPRIGEPARPATAPAQPAARPTTPPGAIASDVLMVDDMALAAPEVLYPLADRIEELRKKQTERGFTEQVTQLVRRQVQQDIGLLLIYKEAIAPLSKEQRTALEQAVDRETDQRVARDFGGSKARFEAHLERFGMSVAQFKTRLEREMVVFQYRREVLLPTISLRRDEFFEYFQQKYEEFCSPETRELQMIVVPYDKCLPEGVVWARATSAQQAQARLEATRRIRAAHAELANRPFDEVAREYSRGPNAEQGGSWGQIGKPLQAPYDKISALIFSYSVGQYSEPQELPTGWAIVRCAQVVSARRPAFVDVQDQIREKLTEQRLDQMADQYMRRLAERATIGAFDPFVAAVVRKTLVKGPGAWPKPESPATAAAAP